MSGEHIGAFGLTEPRRGTDAAMQKTTPSTRAITGSINGTKNFITNAGVADTFVVFAMTDKEKGNKGISAFIVKRISPVSASARMRRRWASALPRRASSFSRI